MDFTNSTMADITFVDGPIFRSYVIYRHLQMKSLIALLIAIYNQGNIEQVLFRRIHSTEGAVALQE